MRVRMALLVALLHRYGYRVTSYWFHLRWGHLCIEHYLAVYNLCGGEIGRCGAWLLSLEMLMPCMQSLTTAP